MLYNFSKKAKDEILPQIEGEEAKAAFLSAVVRCYLVLEIKGGAIGVSIRIENDKILSLLEELLNNGYSYKKEQKTILIGGSDAKRFLVELKIFSFSSEDEFIYEKHIHEDFISKPNLQIASLQGLFCAAGSVTIKKGYRLEFSFLNGFLADDCADALRGRSIAARKKQRRDKFFLFITDSQLICDFLTLVGAINSSLELYSLLAQRELTRQLRRGTNFDMANVTKASDNAAKQLQQIEKLVSSGGYFSLDEKLQEAALLRVENPEATLQELATLAGISKSGMRHRLERLVRKEE